MFQSQLVLVDYQPDEWVLARPLVWRDGDTVIEVPLRFITDLASTPRFLRVLPAFDVNGLSRRPAVIHDWLYCSHLLPARADADALLRQALLAEGVSEIIADEYWLGVRAGGWRYWNERRKNGGLQEREDFAPVGFLEQAAAGLP